MLVKNGLQMQEILIATQEEARYSRQIAETTQQEAKYSRQIAEATQQEAQNSRHVAIQSQKLAVEMKKDSVAMKTVRAFASSLIPHLC
jgi:hypothetical protein